jgi:hypothetical protein
LFSCAQASLVDGATQTNWKANSDVFLSLQGQSDAVDDGQTSLLLGTMQGATRQRVYFLPERLAMDALFKFKQVRLGLPVHRHLGKLLCGLCHCHTSQLKLLLLLHQGIAALFGSNYEVSSDCSARAD